MRQKGLDVPVRADGVAQFGTGRRGWRDDVPAVVDDFEMDAEEPIGIEEPPPHRALHDATQARDAWFRDVGSRGNV